MANFVKVEDPSHLIPTVEGRLPASSWVYNQLKSYDKLKNDMDILIYEETTPNKSLWIITRYYRDDRGPWISISPPPPDEGGDGVPEDVKQSIASREIFNWDEDYVLTSPIHISKYIINLNLDELGHIIRVNPCYVFHMKPEDALELKVSPPLGTHVKPLDPETGTPFIANNWEYKRERTHVTVRKCIQSLHSGGLFLDGDEQSPVSGAITGGFGLISMLHTSQEHRRKGYASLVMRFLFQEMAKDGLQPCLISEMDNETAVNFHHSLGLRLVSKMTIMTRGNH